MSKRLSSSARRVQEALEGLGFSYEVQELPKSTRTAVDAARALGCHVGQIVKSLIFKAERTGRPILVIASGSNRVDEERIGERLGEPIQMAHPDFVRQRTGFAIGGVAPLGHIEHLETFIDEDLLQYDQVWAAAGTPNAVFRLDPADLAEMTEGRVLPVS